LLGNEELQPIPDPTAVNLLYGSFSNDDESALEAARLSKTTAEDQLARYSFETAYQSAAMNGLARLRKATPTPDSLLLYAQLSFTAGQAQLGIRRQVADAPRSFALAHRLAPTFIPDPARYLPDVIEAFEAAKRRWTGKGTLSVGGIGRLWIDGKDFGTAPVDVVEVDAGPHVVWLTGPDRNPHAMEVVVEAGKKARVTMDDTPASKEDKLHRARSDLRTAPDPTARAARMKQLAQLVGVRDAVLLSSANGKINVQYWNDGTRPQPGFTSLHEYKNEKPADLLLALAPKKAKAEPPPVIVVKPLVDNRRWYERRTWQASIAIGVIAAIIGGYYIYQAASDDTFGVEGVGPGEARVRW
jgi:hypothetical protein